MRRVVRFSAIWRARSLSRDAFDGLLAGGVNIQHEQRVGIGEGGGELVHQVAGAGVAMRLEDDVDLAKSALARGGQRGPNLGGMVAVVVDHADARGLAAQLEAAVDAAEAARARCESASTGMSSPSSNRNGGRGIQHVVSARDMQSEFAQVLFAIGARRSGSAAGRPAADSPACSPVPA